jgi:hypothetical protein
MLALGGACVVPDAFAQTTSAKAGGTTIAVTDIAVVFKLDPRLTAGLYMGDRWVSPPTYSTVHPGKQATL